MKKQRANDPRTSSIEGGGEVYDRMSRLLSSSGRFGLRLKSRDCTYKKLKRERNANTITKSACDRILLYFDLST